MIVSSLCNASTRFSALQQANNHIPADNTHVCDEFRVCMETSALMRHSGEEAIDVRKMTKHKRSPCTVDQSSVIYLASKRHKSDLTISAKERKEKLSERIVALQQLVSPYGKSDTASVLTEAMDYIRFLHEQVKVLSAPYLLSTPTTKMQELKPYSLRSRGLCLVPVDSTIGVAQTNGADIWAPIKTCSPKFENNTSNFH